MRDPFTSSRFKHFVPLREVSRFEAVPGGWSLLIGEEPAEVTFLRPDIVKVVIGHGDKWTRQISPACCHPAVEPPEVTRKEGLGFIEVSCGGTRVVIDIRSFAVDVFRADGTAVCRSRRDENGASCYFSRLNEEFVVQREADILDLVYGLGEKTGRLNKRGRNYTLWNTDVLGPDTDGIPRTPGEGEQDPASTSFDPYYVSIPFFYHGRETGEPELAVSGHFIDNPCGAHFDFRDTNSYRIHFNSGPYTEYIFTGPLIRDILRAYTWMTGRMAVPPLWSLGYHQCRWRRYTQERVLRMAKLFREKEIPCDTLWLDIDYMDEYRVFTWNSELFPDAEGMIEELKSLRFQMITIVDPGVKEDPDYPVYQSGKAINAFCQTETGRIYIGQVWPGRTAFPDFTKAATRAWWGGLNAQWVKSGIAGIWNDMNEPSTGRIPPGAMRFDFDGLNLSHEFGHNLYAMFMAMGTVEGLNKALPGMRTFVLSRAGSPGIQRYAANWLGDNMARWDHLAMSIPMSLNMGLSGQAFVGADVGGFAEASTGELLARWMAYGAMTPFFRNHNMGQVDQYPWAFGPAVEEICRRQVRLRYRLLPYFYSTFVECSRTGDPVLRPLVFAYQSDRTVRQLDDQFLLGEHLLVAPVFSEGQTARHVYLPEGTWYDWHTARAYPGCRYVTADAPLEHVPLFVQGGAVVPAWPEVPGSTKEYFPETMDLIVPIPLTDGKWESVLHEDDGITTERENGACYETAFSVTRSGERITIEAKVHGKGFPQFRRKGWRIQIWSEAKAVTVTLGGKELAARHGFHEIPFSVDGFVMNVTEKRH